MMRLLLGTVAAVMTAGAPALSQNLFQELAETGRFDRFLAGMEAAGLDDLLTGPGPVTVFAPTDEAYAGSVGAGLQQAFQGDPDLAREVLLTHVAEGAAYPADDMPRTLEMANDETVTVEWTGRELLATVDAGTSISEPVEIESGDIRSGNGIAHPVSGLLLPQDSTLAALVAEDVAANTAPDDDAAGPAEGTVPIPSDGSYLDDELGDADGEAIALAPAEEPAAELAAEPVAEPVAEPIAEPVAEPEPEPEPVEDEGATVTVLTTDEDAASSGGAEVIFLTPSDEPSAAAPPADATPPEPAMSADASAAVERATDAAEETVATTAPAIPEAPAGGDVVIEEMNVTVEAAPQVEPRTVAPSRMTGSPAPQEPAAPSEQAQAAPSEGGAGAEPGSAGPAGAPEEEILSSTMIGWPVYGQDGEEVGEVGNVIISQGTGAVDGVLVEIGGFLGTNLGGRLVRVDLEELRIDAADEALIADVPGGEISQREDYEGPELNP